MPVVQAENQQAAQSSIPAPFNFAQEVSRQPRGPASSASSNISLPSTPDVATVNLDDDDQDVGCDAGMCPICLVVPKQSPKKRFCRDHQQCDECIERSSFKGVDKKRSPMEDTPESTAFKQIFGWRGNEPNEGPGQPRLANKIVGRFVLSLVVSTFSNIRSKI